jgi:hypothetical protein
MSEPVDVYADLKRRIREQPDEVERFLHETYQVLKATHNQGDWDAQYYRMAVDLWDRLGEWMYP